MMPLTASSAAMEVPSAVTSTMPSSTRRHEQPKYSGQASYIHDIDEWRTNAEHNKLLDTEQRMQARKGNGVDDNKRVYLLLKQVPDNAILWLPSSLERRVHAVDELIPLVRNLRVREACCDPTRSGCRDGNTHSCQPITAAQFAWGVLPRASSIEAGVDQHMPISFLTKRMNNTGTHFFKPNGRRGVSWHTLSKDRDALEKVKREQVWIKVKAIVVFPHLWDQISSSPPPRNRLLSTHAEEILTTCGKNPAFLLVLENIEDMYHTRSIQLPNLAKAGEATMWERTSSLYDKTALRIVRPEGGGQYAAGLTIKVGDQQCQRVKIRVRTLDVGEELYEIIS